MTQLHEIVQYLDNLLEPQEFQDGSLNGLQVETSKREIQRVAVAVDAAEATIEQAIQQRANLMLVHHGLFWGKERPLKGPLGRKVELLMQSGVSLYTSHLPLDAHPEVGNNVLLAKIFEVTQLQPFAKISGKAIGLWGELTAPRPIEWFVKRSESLLPSSPRLPLVLKFGSDLIKRVGFVSGSGSSCLVEAASLQLDLLISGEAKYDAYHATRELKINALFAGHYRTETLDVRELASRLEKHFNVSTVFIEHDTGI